MAIAERLEARALFALVAWDVAISSGSGQTIGSTLQAQLIDFVQRTGNEWASLIPQDSAVVTPVTLRVSVVISSGAAGTTGRLAARSITQEPVGTASTVTRFDQRATAFARYGRPAVGGSGADIELDIDPGFLTNNLWFDPDPANRGTPGAAAVPSDRVDAYSAILHEMGHAFFFNGLLDEASYQPIGSNPAYRSTFDSFVGLSNGAPFFTGPQAQAVYGSPAPLTQGNLYHFGNLGGAGTELVTGGELMNGQQFNNGQRYFLTDLDRAVAADVISAGTRPAQPPPPPPPQQQPVTINFTGNVTFPFTTSGGVRVQLLLRGVGGQTGSGFAVFPAGTSVTDPVGDPSLIQILNTTSRTSVSFTASAPVTLANVQIARVVGSLSAPNVTFSGVTVLPGVGTLTLGGVEGSLTVGTGVRSTRLTLGDIVDATVTLPAARFVSVASFRNTDANNETLTLGATPNLSIPGGLSGTLQVNGALGTASLGTLSNAIVNVTGAVTRLTTGDIATSTLSLQRSTNFTVLGNLASSRITASGLLGNLTVTAAVTNTAIIGATGIGNLIAGSVSASQIFAGVAADTTLPATLPASQAFVSRRATIRSFRTTAFASTLIVAPSTGPLNLGSVATDNAGGRFGLYADTLGPVSAATPGNPVFRTPRLSRATNTATGDFAIVVV